MASQASIEVLIKAAVEGIEEVKKLSERVTELSEHASHAATASQHTAEGVASLGKSSAEALIKLNPIGAAVEGLSEGFKKLREGVTHAAEAFLAYLGIEGVDELVKEAAAAERVAFAFQAIGQNAGFSKEQLEEFSGGLEKIGFTSDQANAALTKLINTGIDVSKTSADGIRNVEKLGQLAQNLSVVTGQGEAETLNLLSSAIARQNDRLLRQIGIRVDQKAAEQKYAEQLGITTAELDRAGKAQAFFNAIIEQSGKTQGLFIAAQETAALKMSKLGDATTELKEHLGTQLLPTYKAVLDATFQVVEAFDKMAKKSLETASVGENIRKAFEPIINGARDLAIAVLQRIQALAPGIAAVGSAIGAAVGSVLQFVAALVNGIDNVKNLNKVLFDLGVVIAVTADLFITALSTISVLVGALAVIIGGLIEGIGKFLSFIPGFGLLGEGIADVGEALKDLGKVAEDVGTKQLRNMFLEGESAIGRFISKIKDASDQLKNFTDEQQQGAFEATVAGVKELTRAVEDGEISYKTAKKLSEDYILSLKRWSTELPEHAIEINHLRKELEEMGGPLAKTKDDINQFVRAVADGAIQGEAARTKYDALGEEIKSLAERFPEAKTEIAQLSATLGTAGTKIGVDFTAAVRGLKLNLEDLKLGFPAIVEAQQRWFSGFVAGARQNGVSAEGLLRSFEQVIGSAKNTSQVMNFLNTLLTEQSLILPKLGESFAIARARFVELLDAEIKGVNSAEKYAIAQRDIKAAVEANVLTVDDAKQKTEELDDAYGAFLTKLAAPVQADNLKALGKTFEEVTTGITESSKKVSNAVRGMAADADIADVAFGELFKEKLGAAKTLEDLKGFSLALDDAATHGRDTATAVDALTSKGEVLFQSLLKATTTKQGFEDLDAKILKLRDTNQITGAVAAKWLEDVRTKAHDAGEQMVRLAQQETAVAEAASSAAQKDVAVSRAGADVADQRLVVEESINRARTEGTKESKLQLAADQAQLAAKQQQQVLAQREADVASASIDLLIAKQNQLNADKALANDTNNTSLQAEVRLTTSIAQRAEVVVEETKQAASAQSAVASAASATADAAGKAADNAKKLGDNLKGASFAIGHSGNDLKQQFEELGVSAGHAANLAADYLKRINDATVEIYHQIQGVTTLIGRELFRGIRETNEEFERMIEFLRRDKEEADAFLASFQRIAAAAQQMAEDIENGVDKIKKGVTGSEAWANAMAEVAKQAKDAFKSAEQSVNGFLSNISSIHQELLRQQGKEKEAVEENYNQRRKQLAIEERLLEIEILKAQIIAKAAGFKDEAKELGDFLKQVQAGYKQALADLDELERLELAKIAKTADAQKEADKQAAIDAQNAQNGGFNGGGGGGGTSGGATSGGPAPSGPANTQGGVTILPGQPGSGTISPSFGLPNPAAQIVAGSQQLAGVIAGAGTTIAGAITPLTTAIADLKDTAKATNTTPPDINLNVDGKGLLTEDTIRRTILPVIIEAFRKAGGSLA